MLMQFGELDRLHLVMTEAACTVASEELSPDSSSAEGFIRRLGLPVEERRRIACWENSELTAPVASGSHLLAGVVVLPCSSGTAGALANGISRGLAQRLGDVALKERRPLILGIRESPMSPILLENLLKLSRAGALIMPPVPAFYLGSRPEAFLDDFLSAYCLRILDMLGIHLKRPELRWGE